MKHWCGGLFALGLVAALTGCSSDTGGNGGGGSSTTTSSSSTGGGGGTGSPCGEAPAGLRCYSEGTYGDPECAGGAWVCPASQGCGLSTDPPCPEGQLCFDGTWACGAGPQARCLPAYTEADCAALSTHEVCGCDGTLHESICAAHAAGVNAALLATCGAAASGTFACGYTSCQRNTEYCDFFGGDQDYIGQYECKPVPVGTCGGGTVSCSCFTPGEQCNDDGNGGLTASSYN